MLKSLEALEYKLLHYSREVKNQNLLNVTGIFTNAEGVNEKLNAKPLKI